MEATTQPTRPTNKKVAFFLISEVGDLIINTIGLSIWAGIAMTSGWAMAQGIPAAISQEALMVFTLAWALPSLVLSVVRTVIFLIRDGIPELGINGLFYTHKEKTNGRH
jgi:hypothetical protein